ncbi:hypothetical protein NECID01_0123 [Nematocida sp. AWRm77]|nr:hypothetical protein NECID01_0123 [Nematocida sp. AWRm77]
MFKRYKLKPKTHAPLALRARKVEVSKRITEESARLLAMLKHTSSTVRMRGAKAAGELRNLTRDMVIELLKMSQHEKKEVRAVFYAVAKKQLQAALPSELKVWEELLFLYMGTMTTCVFRDTRKDSLHMVDLLVKHFPAKLREYKAFLCTWLEKDHQVVSLEPEHTQWAQNIEKRLRALKALKKEEAVQTSYTSRISLFHTHVSLNGAVAKHFLTE